MIVLLHAEGQAANIGTADEDLVVFGGIAETRRQIHRCADVVLALEHQHFTGGDPHAHRQGLADLFTARLHVESEANGHLLVDGHDHASVAQPLVDADAPGGGHIADLGPELGQNVACGGVPVASRVLRESGQIHEHEGSFDFHDWGQATPDPDGPNRMGAV